VHHPNRRRTDRNTRSQTRRRSVRPDRNTTSRLNHRERRPLIRRQTRRRTVLHLNETTSTTRLLDKQIRTSPNTTSLDSDLTAKHPTTSSLNVSRYGINTRLPLPNRANPTPCRVCGNTRTHHTFRLNLS
jgi:hypothetical protein